MRAILFAMPIAAAMLLASLPVEAHHSFSGTYDVSKEITLKGKIVEVSFRSPHSFFFIEARTLAELRSDGPSKPLPPLSFSSRASAGTHSRSEIRWKWWQIRRAAQPLPASGDAC